MVKNGKKINFSIIEGGICAPKNFFAAGLSAGIKKSKKKDLALIYTPHISTCSGFFTTNKVKAAPIIFSQKIAESGKAQAIVANSGNANACTGKKGYQDAVQMANTAADALRISKDHVLVASTGIIGNPLPMKKIESGIWSASRMIRKDRSSDAAEAILTTDLRKKEIAVEIPLGKDKSVKIGGIAKGSGMICPNMATMLSFITTDAGISQPLLKSALKEAVEESFNMITVDNDMSTNDCVFILANGQSQKISGGREYKYFCEALKFVCKYLAKEIARDGEGAQKLFSISVVNAKSVLDARIAAKTVAGSSLFKCAVHGADPNVGRILAAIGYSKAFFDPNKIDIFLDDIILVKKGELINFDRHKASALMKKSDVDFKINFNIGKFSAQAWGCDLTKGYVDINAKYHT